MTAICSMGGIHRNDHLKTVCGGCMSLQIKSLKLLFVHVCMYSFVQERVCACAWFAQMCVSNLCLIELFEVSVHSALITFT